MLPERRDPPLREATLVQALTSTDRLSQLLPVLHHRAVAAVNGRASILLQFDRSGDWLQATSAFGIDSLPIDPWPADAIPNRLFLDSQPLFVPDLQRTVRGVSEYLGTASAVLVPLVQVPDPLGALIVGCVGTLSEDQLQ